jgi:hypothetical protein
LKNLKKLSEEIITKRGYNFHRILLIPTGSDCQRSQTDVIELTALKWQPAMPSFISIVFGYNNSDSKCFNWPTVEETCTVLYKIGAKGCVTRLHNCSDYTS